MGTYNHRDHHHSLLSRLCLVFASR
jgi:hypothetical protein